MNESTYYRLKEQWAYVDSPWDLLIDCEIVTYYPNAGYMALCVTSTILGILSAYLLPLVCSFGVFANFLIAGVFLFYLKKPTRQLIYFAFLAIADALTIFSFGWLWIFPAKGLPYASRGRVYYFSFQQSRGICSFHRFFYHFTSTLSANLLLLAATDRCYCVYYPLKARRLRSRYLYYLVLAVIILSFFMILPFWVLVDEHYVSHKLMCWADRDNVFFLLYGILFSKACLVQPLCVGLLNIAFAVKLRHLMSETGKTRDQGSDQQSQQQHRSCNKKEISASVTLIILSVSTLCVAFPQAAAYVTAFVIPYVHRDEDTESPVRLAYNIADMAWHFIFLRSSLNVFLYTARMHSVRAAFKSFFLCAQRRNTSGCTVPRKSSAGPTGECPMATTWE